MRPASAVLFAALAALGCAAPSEPSDGHTREHYYPYSYPAAYARAYAGAPFGSPFVYVSPYAASAGPEEFPSFSPFPPFAPFPSWGPPSWWQPMVPWYKGPNVCPLNKKSEKFEDVTQLLKSCNMVVMVPDKLESSIRECRGDDKAYCCLEVYNDHGKTMYNGTMYQCCHGFKVGPSRVCSEVDLKNLTPTLRDLKSMKFVQAAEKVGFAERFHSDNLTVFCPQENELESFLLKQQERYNEISRTNVVAEAQELEGFLRKVISSHITEGFVGFDEVLDQSKLRTEYPEASIRMDIYFIPHKMVTANCVPIISPDHYARNGIVHLVEKVLPIPTKTVADIVAANPEFSILKRLLSQAGLVQILRDPNGNFTLFAPTDGAFHFQRFLTRNECVTSLMKNHILEHVICSSAITGYAESMNLLGSMLSLSREADNKVYVENVQVVVKDIVGTNGVVHIIDGLLVPREAKPLTQVLKETRLTGFLNLLKYTNMNNAFDKMKNVTFFVPSNEAIKKIPWSRMEHLDNESLHEILLFHSAKSEFYFHMMGEEEILATQADRRNIRVEQYNTQPYHTKQVTVQCARVLSPNNQLCGSVLHVIDRVLLPSESNVVDVLDSSPEFSFFRQLLGEVGLDLRLRGSGESFTVLAPTNDVFQQMPHSFLSGLRRDVRRTADFLKMHLLPGSLCCNRLAQTVVAGRRQARSLDGSLLKIELLSPLRIGDARVLECDKAADNGVVHALDNFVYSRLPKRNPNPDFSDWF